MVYMQLRLFQNSLKIARITSRMQCKFLIARAYSLITMTEKIATERARINLRQGTSEAKCKLKVNNKLASSLDLFHNEVVFSVIKNS